MHWYQRAPREEGAYLIVPRVFKCAPAEHVKGPEDCIVAEGEPFRFCVSMEDPLPTGACPGGTPSAPIGLATFSGGDTLYPGLGYFNPKQCIDVEHHWEGTLDGRIAPDSESELTEAFTGTFQLDAMVKCEEINTGTGEVEGLTITSTGLQFQFEEGYEFVRVGSEVTAHMYGVCTSGADPYLCELTFTGLWVPHDDTLGQVYNADVTSGTLVVGYDSDLDTWED